MTNQLTRASDADAAMLERVLVEGDLSRLSPAQRLAYYRMRCDAAGLDFRAQPFQFLTLQGKLTLYATRACTQQLAARHGVTTHVTDQRTEGDLRLVTVRARAADGRETDEMGVVGVKGLAGEALANAYMKALTKAKRRAVLAICGLGDLDETEVDSVPRAKRVNVDMETGEVQAAPSPAPARAPRVVEAQVVDPARAEAERLRREIGYQLPKLAAAEQARYLRAVKVAGDDVGRLRQGLEAIRAAVADEGDGRTLDEQFPPDGGES
ncbi:MAG: hypothetical protein KIT58_13370 [Planctomycetota bacterium]|nr:hypothetical protein [Planctomycetota bacterium]